MVFWLALAAAIGCALCNGVAAILQKLSADKEARAKSLNLRLLLRLVHDWPYLVGILLDGLAWILTLVAVHSLPLFVVQPIIAFAVVITALIEVFIFHRKLRSKTIVGIGVIVVGLLFLALAATPETAAPASNLVRWTVIFTPLALAAVGVLFAGSKKPVATIILAATSGLAFGGTAVTGRMLNFTTPYWHVMFNPVFLALVAYGLTGILLFTISLQRNSASIVNAVMITFETIVPITVGLLFLGDHPKPNFWPLLVIGVAVALSGTIVITRQKQS